TGLLLAVLLSWLGSRRLYRPIHRLVALVREPRRDAASMEQDIGYGDSANHPGSRKQDRSTGYDGDEMGYIESRWRDMSDEKQAIQAELKRAYPSLRAGFLMQLVNGHYHMLSEEELMERMAGFGWPLNAGDRIAVLLLQIGRLSSPERRFRENEEQLMTFAAANVAQEFVQGKIQQAEVINFQDTTVAILIPCPAWETPQQTKEQLLTLARELAQMLRSLLKLQAVICYGGPDRVQEVPVLLSYLRGAIRHRDLKEDWQVMELADMLPAGGEAGSYPFSLEKELIQSVRLGHAEESAGRMEAFFRELTHRCVTEKAVQEGALQLLGSLLHTMMEAG
ncbi:AraC family transcriptional regulator, partial [Paenibacillus sepulcri]|nr:AraC family transcriptional regulator [Paenibacillus sepulcri]